MGYSSDTASHLMTEEDMSEYLKSALERGDEEAIRMVLGSIARASRIISFC